MLLKTTSVKTVMPGVLNATDLKEQNNFDSLKQWNTCHTYELFLVITKATIETEAFLGRNFVCFL
jgi:hypothetical protein